MSEESVRVGSRQVPRRFVVGVLLTLAAIVLSHTVALWAGPEATLQRVVIVFVLAAALTAGFHAGRAAGLVAGVVGGAYAVAFFVMFSSRDAMTARLLLGSAIGLSILALAFLAGTLRTRADLANQRALAAERANVRSTEAARRALESKAAELADANADLTRANDALRSVNDGLEAFSYVVAHDLKEPVRAMAVLLEDAEDEAMKQSVRENVNAARRANERLAKLLAGLLDVAHASQLDPRDLVPVYPLEVLESDACEARYAPLRAERGARVESSCLVGTPPVLATKAHLSQILGNLVLNAIKHGDRTSPLVRVRVAPQDADADMILITVEDDGPGFDPGVVDHVGRVAPGRSAGPPGGFGLVIVRRAVERLGGTLWFGESKELGGAAVHFTLPSALRATHREAAENQAADDVQRRAPTQREARTS